MEKAFAYAGINIWQINMPINMYLFLLEEQKMPDGVKAMPLEYKYITFHWDIFIADEWTHAQVHFTLSWPRCKFLARKYMEK